MAKNTKTVRRANAHVPQTDVECADMIAEIGSLGREIETLKADADDQLARIAEKVAEARQPLLDKKAGLEQGVQTYCEANRDRLCRVSKGKFYDFVTGRISWRNLPPSVSMKGGKDAIVAACEALGLEQFLKRTVTVNKGAMQDAPEKASAVEGVTIGSAGEQFVVEPAELAT